VLGQLLVVNNIQKRRKEGEKEKKNGEDGHTDGNRGAVNQHAFDGHQRTRIGWMHCTRRSVPRPQLWPTPL